MNRKISVLAISLICLITVCCSKPEATSSVLPNASPFQNWKIVDLSHTYESNIPLYPGGAPFVLENMEPIENGYYLNKFSTGEHTGTHVDAPSHFAKGGKNIDELPLESLMGPLIIIDMTQRAESQPDMVVTLEDIASWEKQNGKIPSGAFVVMNSNWWKRWQDPARYLNQNNEKVMAFPGFAADTVEFLVRERDIKGVGVDTLSGDKGSSQDFPEHHKLLSAGRVNLENLTNLDQVPTKGAYLIVAPMKIGKGSGAPARIFALVPSK
jgi:kynurenine formamidase